MLRLLPERCRGWLSSAVVVAGGYFIFSLLFSFAARFFFAAPSAFAGCPMSFATAPVTGAGKLRGRDSRRWVANHDVVWISGHAGRG